MKITPELLVKYFDGKCTFEEKNAIKIWLYNLEENVEEISNDRIEKIKDNVWDNISSTIEDEIKNQPIKLYGTRKKRTSHSKQKWLVACSFALLVGFISLKFLFNFDTIIYKTIAGEIKTITLQDGTTVYLNANSTLKTQKEFTDKNRTIELLGEAYFEVAKDSLHPFIVNTNTSKTTVLGTKFNLSAYPDERTVLTLNEGKVSFKINNNKTKELILTPNEQGIIANNILKKELVNAKYYNTWRANNLFFNDDLATVFKDIERKFNINIKVKNTNLLQKKYRGYHKHPNLQNLLKEISFVMKFKVKNDGNTIIIY